jgi:hypothetical protein
MTLLRVATKGFLANNRQNGRNAQTGEVSCELRMDLGHSKVGRNLSANRGMRSSGLLAPGHLVPFQRWNSKMARSDLRRISPRSQMEPMREWGCGIHKN